MFLLVAKGASPNSASFWVASIDGPNVANLTLRIDGRQLPVPALSAPWTTNDGSFSLRTALVAVPGLTERTSYAAELARAGAVVARGWVATPPGELPRTGDSPLRVFLGSCFCRIKDEEGIVGQRFAQLPPGARPDLNLLCGDQVYLDSPASYFLRPHFDDTLENVFAENYEKTWDPESLERGFAAILARGPTYFLADDHEFWNNAPSKSFAVHTWTDGGRAHWWKIARALYERFQSDDAAVTFAIGRLSFFLADTRVNRAGERFMRPADLAALDAWIAHLDGPGVLAIGQPLFTEKAGNVGGTFGDWALPNFRQYEALVQSLVRSTHSIVVVTGDVHFGRISYCTLPTGAELVEVISSPLRLVDDVAGKKWEPPPSVFPAVDVPNVPKLRIACDDGLREWKDHFLMLDFSATGNGVHLAVTHYPIEPGAGPRDGRVVFHRNLH